MAADGALVQLGSDLISYRRVVVLSEDRPGALSIAVPALAVAYEVLIDGQRIGGEGRLPPGAENAPTDASRVHAIPKALGLDGSLAIEIVTHRPAMLERMWGQKRLIAPPAIGASDTIALLRSDYLNRFLAGLEMWRSMAAVMLVIALICLSVFVRRRELRTFLWFGLVAFGMMVTNYLRGSPFVINDDVRNLQIVIGVLHAGTNLFFFTGAATLLGVQRTWSFRFVIATSLLHGVLVALPGSVGIEFMGWRWRLAVQTLVLVGYCALWMPKAFSTGRGVAAAWTFATIAAVSMAGQALKQAGLLPEAFPGTGPFAVPATAITMVIALVVDHTRAAENLEAEQRAAKRFVPLAFLRLLGRENVREVGRGEAIGVVQTVLFADIRGFTTLSERLGPDRTFEFMNQYHAVMEPVITGVGGFINQYYGDGIMALFPSADAGVDAAVGMCTALETFNASQDETLAIGIGLHTGDVMLGTIGGEARLDTGVIGDAVNTAARIESLTKEHGRPILFSGATKDALQEADRQIEEVATVTPKGRVGQVTLYAPR